jgi:outer membrane protein assembly factor BamB
VAPHADPPVRWSVGENVVWKTSLPGRGLSTPIVWGDRIFLTASVPFGEAQAADGKHADGAHDNVEPERRHRYVVLAVHRNDGRLLWERTVRSARPHEATHVTGSWASNSAVTDGRHVYASFGSAGIYALDLDGKVVWEKDLGDMQVRHEHGEGSSPALHGDTLLVNWDHQGPSYLFALDKHTGAERWKVERDEITSWSTPLVVEHGGTTQVVVAATGKVRAYDLKTGTVVWECGGLSRNVVASPVAADGFVYVANSYDWQAMLAIRLADARGDITGTDAVVWQRSRDTPYVPSPVLVGDALCFLKHSHAMLTCVEAKTGETRFGPVRLEGLRGVFASPVAASGRLYISGRNGATAVVDVEAPFKLLAVNRLDDSFSASPAVAGDDLFLRGDGYLYRIGNVATKP